MMRPNMIVPGGGRWFAEGPSPFQTVLAMVGVKPGGVAVVFGAGDGALAAELAGITGLNGRTLVVDPDAAAEARVEKAAASAGRLVEFARTRLASIGDAASDADVAVINCQLGAQGRAASEIVSEAVRILRAGGRVIVIEGWRRKGLFGFGRSSGPEPMASDAVCALLAEAGLRATRVLGEERGVSYIEGIKSGTTGTTGTAGTG